MMDQFGRRIRAILSAMLLFPACGLAAPANAQAEAPASIHCTPGPFIAFIARNAADLDANAKKTLDVVAQIATGDICWNDARTLLRVAGHRDAGEDSAVSLARAEATRNYLVGKGLPTARIKIMDMGEARLRRPAKKGTIERENSRVELIFQYVTEAPARDTRPR